jgi:hypothetical protein
VTIVGNPTVNDDDVTVRLRVKDKNGRPVGTLKSNQFRLQVDQQPLAFDPRNWKNPEQTTPSPTWIVVLLDMSGSMARPARPGQTTTKLAGAIAAIKQFKRTMAERSQKSGRRSLPQLSIVPFGKSGKGCAGFPVTPANLDKFFPANAFNLENQLNFLAQQSPCAATDLYAALNQTINFLSNPSNSRFAQSKNAKELQPRLSIVLLSDGFDTNAQDDSVLQNLIQRLRQVSQITVHTLGYGLSPKELGKQYQLGRAVTRRDLWWTRNQRPKGKVPADEFVDPQPLSAIAKTTGGIAEFSAEPSDIAKKLQLFLSAVFGEYEIRYEQPSAERASHHQVQVTVKTPQGSMESAPKIYRITNFGRSLPRQTRLSLLIVTLIGILIAGGIPFRVWMQSLKKDLQQS